MRDSLVCIEHPVQVVGLISDTHGLARSEALSALRDVDLIVHSGDIGKREVLAALEEIAPVIAIKGNNDTGPWVRRLPETKRIEIDRLRCYVVHDANRLDFDPARHGYHVVISGHTHLPAVATRGGVLFVNPGSAGPRRFKLPVAIGKLRLPARSQAPAAATRYSFVIPSERQGKVLSERGEGRAGPRLSARPKKRAVTAEIIELAV